MGSSLGKTLAQGCLRNPLHERFAIEWVERELACDPQAKSTAYGIAFPGSGPTSRADNARKLSHRPEVKRRHDALMAEALEFRNVRAAQLVIRLDRCGRANVADFFERAKDGKLRLRDITKLPRELTDAIESIKFNDAGEPELRLVDKNLPNITLLKYLGALPEPEGGRTQVNIYNALSIEDQSALADLIEALPGGSSEPGEAAAPERDQRGTETPPV